MSNKSEIPETISICGVMAQALPEQMDDVKSRLLEIPGLEVHAISEDGKMVITVESNSYKETGRHISTLQKVKGVLSASMIYQHTEELEATA
jgi:nitrate reductase NapD